MLISWIKSRVIRCCPKWIIHIAKRLYYPYVVRSFTEKDWDYYPIIKRLVGSGDCVVDVGANIGYISKLLSEIVGKTGNVYSIEPIPQTYSLLCSNLTKLKINNVHPVNVAASDKNSKKNMAIPTYVNGHKNFYESRIYTGSEPVGRQQVCLVEAKPLDEILSVTKTHISFIKMDVEGHELEAIMGARGLLEESKPVLLIEIEGNLDDSTSKAGQLFHILSQYGYSPHLLFDGNVVPRNPGMSAVDYLFITSEHSL